ncbi:MAG TPA: DUF6401 family natural product biosynthesis protein [Pseudonocardiaceae bacterium]|jgi:hypothetical protein|nr:DUF6401 family natural product biosynthesis protein [Pseudonocardiaceae bacterium]
MPGFAAAVAEFSARRALAQLHDQLGTAGLAAAAVMPGLAAVIDQHSAAVRDILEFGVEGSATVAGVILLAGYARGLLDHAGESGRRPQVPRELTDWAGADWLTSRLLGVCALANRPTGQLASACEGPESR